MASPLLQGKALTLAYQDGQDVIYAVRDLNLTVDPRQFVGLLGPSGSGKSSLLYVLSGIKAPTSGEVLFRGSPLEAHSGNAQQVRRRHFGFVFQQFFLLNYLDVLGNVLVGALVKNGAARARARELTTALGLEGLEHRKPYELSQGQRQRVAIARALANEPAVLFVDEPTANLDQATGRQVMSLLKEQTGQGAIVVVSHDETALAEADVIYRMRDGEISLLSRGER